MLLPLRDTIRRDRPPLVTAGLVGALVATGLATAGGEWDLVQLAASALALWILGSTLEGTLGRVALVVLCVAGGLAVHDTSGAVAAVAGAYLVLYPRARVLAALLAPVFFTMLELPALLLVALWALQLVLREGPGAQVAACAGAFAAAAVAARLLARPQPSVPLPYRVA